MSPKTMKAKYRTVFLSDLHLGFNGAHAQQVTRLLKRIRCQKLYLVGDVIDMWRLKQRWHWPQEHNDVVRRILKMAKKGTEVIYVPGNHDEAARQFCNLEFGGVKLRQTDIHETADGRKLLITHGDQFDLVVKHSRLLSILGGMAYDWLLWLNIHYNRCRSLLGLKYWSLSHFVKLKVKRACTFISQFEQAVIEEANRQQLDGVVCGHIHKAEHTQLQGKDYYNCGDWVESCTLVVEHFDGRMEIVDGLKLLEIYGKDKQVNETPDAENFPSSTEPRKRRKTRKTVPAEDLEDTSWQDEDEQDETIQPGNPLQALLR